jgi:hypothetical protein
MTPRRGDSERCGGIGLGEGAVLKGEEKKHGAGRQDKGKRV